MKKKSIFALLCLLLSLVLVGCANNNASNNGTDTLPTKIIAPVDPEMGSSVGTSETEAESETEITTETEDISDTAEETTADTESSDETAETAPTFDVDHVPYVKGKENVFDLFGALSAGKPIKGEFVSKESDSLVMIVKFDCQAESDGSVTVDRDIGLETYAIKCGARPDTGEITINGVTHNFSTEALSHSGITKEFIPLTTYTYRSAPEETSCLIDVSWSFNGVHGGTRIDDLTAGALLTWVIPANY